MSSKKTSRKKSRVASKEDEESTSKKKPKTEDVKAEIPDLIPFKVKQPIVAPNGKVFYPCQYCSKIFPQKTTSVTHMKKCPNKSHILTIGHKNESSVNNNDISQVNSQDSIENQTTREEHKGIADNDEKCEENQVNSEDCLDLNSSGSSMENKSPEPKIKINQVVTVKSAQLEKQAMNDTSIYDYDEQDPEEELKENSDNNSCKHCDAVFENPLDLLRHTRDIHNFPKTILPPDEIEKYFDSPNREFCPICKKKIKTNNFRSVFIKHLLVHTTGLTHECKICKKKFRRRDHMRVHEKRHIVSG